MPVLGIIGGSGLYDLPGLDDVKEIVIETPFGPPSSPVVTGSLGDTTLAFIARHGRGHTFTPGEVPYRANILAIRSLGATHLLSVSAVGSLREDLPPRMAVVPDQIIDRTDGRTRSFFNDGVVAHVGLADPYCDAFRQDVYRHVTAITDRSAIGGTYLCIEGPQFSTRAESNLYRSWGASIIGMTAMPEARLAREAGLCYATLAMVTDYDVWHDSEEDVTVEMVQRVLAENVATGQEVVRRLASSGLPHCESSCRNALDGAVITSPEHLSDEAAARVALFGDHDPAAET
ncbi:MAG: S-methyl-5'-thioadenosine phosphorylase [Chloroflexota bacterium]|nr:S-methyl-5'-thioadenosine phosphorylase [Chloroflexota bacterium]